jgi:hypothetical protein
MLQSAYDRHIAMQELVQDSRVLQVSHVPASFLKITWTEYETS